MSVFIIAVCAALGVYALTGGAVHQQVAVVGGETQRSDACTGTLNRATTLADFATGDVAAFMVAEKNTDFSRIAFVDGAGEDRTLQDWDGKVVFLNLWATWCGPCRHEMPGIAEMKRVYGDHKFDVIALSLDQGGHEKPRAFLDEINAADLGFYQDNSNATFLNLRDQDLLAGLPGSYLLDTNGCMLGALLGPAEWMSEDAQALVRAAKGI